MIVTKRTEAGLLSGAPVLSNPNSATEKTRRLVHFAMGAMALLVGPLGRLPCALLAAAALLYNAVLAPALRLDRAYRRPGEGRWGGLTTYPLAVLGLLLVAPAPVAAGAWAVLAACDPVAAAVGSRCPRPPVPFNRRKSLAGSAAGLVAGVLACYGVLVSLDAPAPLSAALVGGAAGAVAEALPVPFDDNLLIAAAAALALWPLA